jgi:hypothetical protein
MHKVEQDIERASQDDGKEEREPGEVHISLGTGRDAMFINSDSATEAKKTD